MKLNPRYLMMIIPARWYAGGKGLDDFRSEMLSDKRIRKLIDFENSNDIFLGVDVAGGICYFLWNRDDLGQAAKAVNTVLLQSYWQIGRHIVEFEQEGSKKAQYGNQLLTKLSKDLTLEFGKGFSRSNLFLIRKLYLTFPKIQTVSGKSESHETLSSLLSWSHYAEILKSDNDLEINFYSIFQLATRSKYKLAEF